MEALLHQLPELNSLATGLRTVLCAADGKSDPVTILNREQHDYVSTYPSEVITCRTKDGGTYRLLCKYSAPVGNHTGYGHRMGIVHEAEVYRSVLQPIAMYTPRFFGSYNEPATGWTWLFIEYLDGAEKVTHAEDGPALAAHWLGRFHAINEARLSSLSLKFLKRYNREYYCGWIDRTIQYASPTGERFSWLADLQRHASEIFDALLAARATVIHGEYYSQNILIRDGVISPVDWESAAVAAGEIDLASLTEGWPETEVRQYEAAYCDGRWPDGVPATFAITFQAARIYFLARWLGEQPDWNMHPCYRDTSEQLSREITRWRESFGSTAA